VNNSANSNIFSKQIQRCLDRYAANVAGTPDDIVCCISARPLSAAATAALEASMDKLGFGRGRTSWITTGDNVLEDAGLDGAELSAADLHAIIETLDPNALIAADAHSIRLLETVYACTLAADEANRILGRPVAAFTNFKTMLETPESKQLAWRVLKTLAFD